MITKKYRKISGDIIFNLISTCIPIATIQLIILPLVASKVGGNKYGLIITVISLVSLLSTPLGNALNNVRLIQNHEYCEKGLNGDFNIVLICSIVFNGVILAICSSTLVTDLLLLDIVLISLNGVLNVLREYLIVAFRLKLAYKNILFNNVFLCLGYIIGYILFLLSGFWQLIYISGGILSLGYIISRSDLYKEPLTKTRNFSKTLKKYLILILATFLYNMISYADKLMLFPLLGPQTVSVYYSATVFSKIMIMGITPISSVMLSYLAKMKSLNYRHFFRLLWTLSGLGIAFYVISIIFSRPILSYLYPQWVNQSLEIIKITSATAVFSAIDIMINPIVLRFCNIYWQLIIATLNIIVYILATLFLYQVMGFKGFCFGILLASIINVIMKVVVYIRRSKQNVLCER